MSERLHAITKTQLEDAISKGSQCGVETAFMKMGLDVTSPSEIIKRQEEFAHLRKIHLDDKNIKKQLQKSFIEKGTYILLTVITLGAYHFFNHGG